MADMTADITIRPEQAGDAAAIRAVHRLAFPEEDVAGLVDALRETEGFAYGLSLVAVAGGEVIGHVLFTPITLETDDGVLPILTLAPLAVTPAWQQGGIGSRLVRRGLEACRQHGHRIVAVVGHASYYPRFGFRRADEIGIAMSHGKLDQSKMVMAIAPGALDGVRGLVRFTSLFD